jgi:methylated-DNA-protein-cysteine methyltransferase-like protein
MIKKTFGKQPLTFSEKVIAIALLIPAGRVMTYGGIARAAGGGALSAQSITTILGKAYDSGERRIPFHRIVYAGGKVWLDNEHRTTRMKLYKKEGIMLDAHDRIIDFDARIFDPRAQHVL